MPVSEASSSKMLKEFLIFSLMVVAMGTAEFRFGGVSVNPYRETRFGKQFFPNK
jgi:hypothetical protein